MMMPIMIVMVVIVVTIMAADMIMMVVIVANVLKEIRLDFENATEIERTALQNVR